MARQREQINLEQQFQEQAALRDPFQQARVRSPRRQGVAPLEPGVSPLERQGEELPAVGVLEQGREQRDTLRDFLAQADPQEEARVRKTDVPKKLRQIGLGDLAEGLSLDQMGRLNLMLRLRERFGEQFFENDSARRAVAAFDEALSRDQVAEDEQMEDMLSSTERTLEELLRMQERGVR